MDLSFPLNLIEVWMFFPEGGGPYNDDDPSQQVAATAVSRTTPATTGVKDDPIAK